MDNLDQIVAGFPEGLKEITAQLAYPRKERIMNYVKKRAAVFFILEDILHSHKADLKEFLRDEDKVKEAVFAACSKRYKSISTKVRTAIIRSFVFILTTKVIFAFAVEGTYEQLFYGAIQWTSIIINTSIPPLLMIVVGLFIRTPKEDNTRRIFEYVKVVLYEESPVLAISSSLRSRKTNLISSLRSFGFVPFDLIWGNYFSSLPPPFQYCQSRNLYFLCHHCFVPRLPHQYDGPSLFGRG